MVAHKLTLMRHQDTSVATFRRLAREVSMLLCYEVTRDLPVELVQIQTPVATMEAPMLAGKKLCVVSILRAGTGILDGMLDLIPNARVGHVGLYRDPKTLEPVEYYKKFPADMAERMVILVDPMLATGNSAAAAVDLVKQTGAKQIKFLCLLAAPEGVARLHESHPDVAIVTASLDSHLNEKGYIVPGLGDAGDRLFGTQ